MAAAVLLACATAACSGGGDDDPESAATTTSSPSAGGASAGSTATTDPAIRIVLLPGRLLVGGNALPFGAPDFQVSSFLERGLGEPVDEDDQTCDAGELHVIEWESLTVYVGAEGFAGWYTDDEAHATDRDIKVGSDQTFLQDMYPEGTVTESSLGTEFFFEAGNGIGLSALIEDGDVSTLWSGATCIAR